MKIVKKNKAGKKCEEGWSFRQKDQESPLWAGGSWAEIWMKSVMGEEPSRKNSKPESLRRLWLRNSKDTTVGPCRALENKWMNELWWGSFFLSTLHIQWWPYASYFPGEFQFCEFYWSHNKTWFDTYIFERVLIININLDIRKNVLCHLSQSGFHKASGIRGWLRSMDFSENRYPN